MFQVVITRFVLSAMRGLGSVKKAKNPLREAMTLRAALTEMLRDARDAYVPDAVTSHYPERILNNTLLPKEKQRLSDQMSKQSKKLGRMDLTTITLRRYTMRVKKDDMIISQKLKDAHKAGKWNNSWTEERQ
jgi:hypothetical protein